MASEVFRQGPERWSVNQQPMSQQKIKRRHRSPNRLSITLPNEVYQYLLNRSDQEGRSLSNLAAFLLEHALRARERGPC